MSNYWNTHLVQYSCFAFCCALVTENAHLTAELLEGLNIDTRERLDSRSIDADLIRSEGQRYFIALASLLNSWHSECHISTRQKIRFFRSRISSLHHQFYLSINPFAARTIVVSIYFKDRFKRISKELDLYSKS